MVKLALFLFLLLTLSCTRNESSYVNWPPLPYQIEQQTLKIDLDQTQALVIGDEMALDFMRFAPVLSKKWLENKKITFNFTHLGSREDGLHRSLDHFSKLKKTPKFVFYFIGNHELYEKKFREKEGESIRQNLQKFTEGKWTTLAYFLPFLKKIIYPSVKEVKLKSKIIEDKTDYSHSQLMNLFSTNFEIFQQELETFIRIARRRDIYLVFVTNPVNINWPPEVVCGSQSPESDALMKKVEYYFVTGEVKRAQALLVKLYKEIPSNAKVYYLLGQTNLKMGNYLQAKGNFISANALDCNRARGNVVYNALAKKLAKQYNIPVIDFFRMVNDDLGTKEIFKDDRFPEDYFYEKLMSSIWNELSPLIKF